MIVLLSSLVPLEIMFLKRHGNRWERSLCVRVCCGGGGHMPTRGPSTEKPRNEYAILDLILKTKRNTPAQSLYLFNVPELHCRRPTSVLAYYQTCSAAAWEQPACCCWGPSWVMIWKNLNHPLHLFLLSFWFWQWQKKRILPRDSIISLQNSLGIIMTVRTWRHPYLMLVSLTGN